MTDLVRRLVNGSWDWVLVEPGTGSLPDFWTVGPQGELEIAPGAIDTTALTLTPKAVGEPGTAALSIGKYDGTPAVIHLDDDGGAVIGVLSLSENGALVVDSTSPSGGDPVLRFSNQGNALVTVYVPGGGYNAIISAHDPGDVALSAWAAAGQTADLLQLYDEDAATPQVRVGPTGAVEISPSADVPALVINAHPGSGQATLPFQFYDEDGLLAVDIDAQGLLDTRHLTVQNPPDTGGSPPASVNLNPGYLEIVTDASVNPAFMIRGSGGGPGSSAVLQVRPHGSGSVLELSQVEDADVPIVIISHTAPTVDAFQLWDNAFNNVLFAITATGGLKPTLPTANPGPGILWNDANVVKVGT